MIQQTKKGLILHVLVQPKSSKNEIIGEFNGRLKIKITAPPIEGKANKAVINFLAMILKIAKSNMKIIKGEKGKEKDILIKKLKLAQINKLIFDKG